MTDHTMRRDAWGFTSDELLHRDLGETNALLHEPDLAPAERYRLERRRDLLNEMLEMEPERRAAHLAAHTIGDPRRKTFRERM